MPFNVAENMLCRRKRLDSDGGQPFRFHIIQHLLRVQMAFQVRQLVEPCQKPFRWPFAEGSLIVRHQHQNGLIFDSAAFGWSFLREFRLHAIFMCLA